MPLRIGQNPKGNDRHPTTLFVKLRCISNYIDILLMAGILHQLIWQTSHYSQGFIPPMWCRISSINSTPPPETPKGENHHPRDDDFMSWRENRNYFTTWKLKKNPPYRFSRRFLDLEIQEISREYSMLDTLQGTITYPNLGKRNTIFKSALVGNN